MIIPGLQDTEHLREVVRCLDRISGMGHQRWRVFEDWVALMFHALQRDDPAYLEVMGRYGNDAPKGKREADLFALAFAEIQLHMRVTDREALGPLYEEYAAGRHRGQFFTPWDVALMMGRMTAPRGRILDPACGAGVMLLAGARAAIEEGGQEALAECEFWGQDVDLTCCMLTALNLTFFNLDGGVMWGNSLAMEVRAAWRTRSTPLGGELFGIDPEPCRTALSETMLERTQAAGDDIPADPVDESIPTVDMPPRVPSGRPSLLEFMR